jgi:hypothetical protein
MNRIVWVTIPRAFPISSAALSQHNHTPRFSAALTAIKHFFGFSCAMLISAISKANERY